MEKGKMKSLARESGAMEVGKEPWYPSITVTEASMKELRGSKVGDKGKMLIEYCVKGVHQYGNGDIEYNLELEKGDIVEETEDKE
jgi:hypothetical protein